MGGIIESAMDTAQPPNDARKKRSEKGLRVVIVRKSDGVWEVLDALRGKGLGTYRLQREAVDAARTLLRERGGVLRVQSESGRIRERVLVGRLTGDRLNSLEGLVLQPEAKGRRKEHDQVGLSDEKRRVDVLRRFAH